MKSNEKIHRILTNTAPFCLIAIFILLSSLSTLAQEEPAESISGNGAYLGVFYGVQWSAGDLSDRFGSNSSVGATFEVFKNQKWIFGVEGQFLFGNEIKEDVFGGIVTDQGHIINSNYGIADIDIKERGINIFAKVGRIHDLWSEQHVSGFKWTIGAGFLQHKIRLKDAQDAVPFFNDDYIKGYDRLTNGFALTEFLGYQFLDVKGGLNFFIGAEFVQGFTKDRRGLNYNTGVEIDDSRFDMLIGLKAGMQITIKGFQPADEIWY